MSERGCVKCGYILTGLPATGTIVTCPECGHANDIAAPLPNRAPARGRAGDVIVPFLWGLVPGTLCAVGMRLDLWIDSRGSWRLIVLAVAGPVAGAITAGVLMFRRTGRAAENSRERSPLWARVMFMVCAMAGSVGIYAVLGLAVLNLLNHKR